MFKSIKKKRPIRKASSSESEEEEVNQEALEETIELQKLRKRAHGVNAATLASGKKVTKVDELVHNDPDPFKLKTGGMLTLDQAKKAAKEQEKAEAGEEEEIIGTQFSKETRVRFVNFLYFIHFFKILIKKKRLKLFFFQFLGMKMKKCENLLKLKWISVPEVEPKTKNQTRYV